MPLLGGGMETSMSNVNELFEKNIKLLDILRLNGGLDKTGLAQKLGVTWPTISSYVDELLNENILLKEENLIRVNARYGYFIGISIGSAQTKICVIDLNMSVTSENIFHKIISADDVFVEQKKYMEHNQKKISQYLFCATPVEGQELIRNINNIFDSIVKIVENQKINIMGIGIAFTGAVDREKKRIIKAFNLECLDELDFEEGILLRNYLDFFEIKGINIAVENNSTAAGIAEKWALYSDKTLNGEPNVNRKYKNCKNVISIYLGAGLGLGIIQDNRIYRGSNNLCGGAGHLEVPNYSLGEVSNKVDTGCTCGGSNCLEYRIRSDVFEETFDNFKNWNSEKIRNFFITNSDKKEIMGKYLGHLINLLNIVLNPDLIIFTGKLYLAIDELWEAIQNKRNENNLKYAKNSCALVKSQLGPTAPAIGAAIGAFYDKFNCDVEWE